MFGKSAFVAICYLFFTFGYIESRGFYHVGELTILILVFLGLSVYYFSPAILKKIQILDNFASFKFLLTLILLINVSVVGAKLGDSLQTNWQFFSLANRILAAGSLVLSLSYLVKSQPAILVKYRLFLLLILALIIRIFSIISAPNPTIDVFFLLRDGPKLLLSGTSPYTLEYPAPYGVYNPTILFVYGPLAAFLFLPSDIIFNDPRFTLVAFDLISAFLIYKIGKLIKANDTLRDLIVAIFAFHPLFPFMTEQSWVEPVIFTFFAAAIYFFLKKRRLNSSTMLGLILAIKAVYVLPLVVFLLSQKAKLKEYIFLIVTPILFAAPFIALDSALYLKRTIFDAGAIQSYPRLTNVSLSIAAVILKYAQVTIPIYATVTVATVFALSVVAKRKRLLEFSVLSVFLTFFVLFMFGPYVLLNYFAFLGNILLIFLLLTSVQSSTKR